MTFAFTLRARPVPTKSYRPASLRKQLADSICFYHTQMPAQLHHCSIDAEPLHQYRPGGYHPLALRSTLKDGRYKILHKLGWGSYSTTWAAKDHKHNRYVAVKISISAVEKSSELKILQAISTLPKSHPGSSHISQLVDEFTLVGPNGSHQCLVLELVGPNVADFIASHCKDDRLPSKLVKAFAMQTLQGIDFLTGHDIGHGDLHTRNIALAVSGLDSLDEGEFIAKLGKPKTGAVSRSDGGPLAPSVPTEIVRPASFQEDIMVSCPSINISDFGEAFFGRNPPSTLHTPLPVRAPEIIFGDQLDHRVDLWSAGCLIFELVTGYPPFDVIMLTPSILVEQMVELASDQLPSRWEAKRRATQEDVSQQDGGYTLQKLLDETYFTQSKEAEFTRMDVARITEVIAGLLKLEPSHRATARETLAHEWFQ